MHYLIMVRYFMHSYSKDESKQIHHWVIFLTYWFIPVSLGSPGERHPILAQALACLLGSFQHLLSSLRRHVERKRQWRSGKLGKLAGALVMCMSLNEVKSMAARRTLLASEVLMYGSALCVMPFCNTFSTRATRKISAWGLVTEKIPWRREGEMNKEADY